MEWSRLYPGPTLNYAALAHYLKVVDALEKSGLTPFITLHHFTNPVWFMARGGWFKSANIDYFLKYLSAVTRALSGRIKHWFIFNEPLVYLFNGYIQGNWPPGTKSFSTALKALKNILAAYQHGYAEIKRICPEAEVTFNKHLISFAPLPGEALRKNTFAAFVRDKLFNDALLDYLAGRKLIDFLAINYYRRQYVTARGLLGREADYARHPNSLGWDSYPEGFYRLMLRLKKYKLPVVITENGTAEKSSPAYQNYLISHLKQVRRAMASGVDIRGYFWWSLLDNFEWAEGFKPRFGLAAVDYKTYQRKIRPYAETYAKIIRNNGKNI